MLAQLVVALLAFALSSMQPAAWPPPAEGDYVIKDFRFVSGETIPELRIHYRTLGAPIRDG